MDPEHRAAWRKELLAARTLAGVATLIYAFVNSAVAILPLLQEQDMQEQALIQKVTSSHGRVCYYRRCAILMLGR